MQFKSTLYVTHGSLDKVAFKRGIEGQKGRFCVGLDAKLGKYVEWVGIPKHYSSDEQAKSTVVKYLGKALTSGLAGNLTKYSNPSLHEALKDNEDKLTLDFLVDQLLPVWNDLGNTHPTSENGRKTLRAYAFKKIAQLTPSMINHNQEMYLKGIVGDVLDYNRKPINEFEILGVIKNWSHCSKESINKHAPVSTISCKLGKHPDQIKIALEYLVRKGDIFVVPNGHSDHYSVNRRASPTRRRAEVATLAR